MDDKTRMLAYGRHASEDDFGIIKATLLKRVQLLEEKRGLPEDLQNVVGMLIETRGKSATYQVERPESRNLASAAGLAADAFAKIEALSVRVDAFVTTPSNMLRLIEEGVTDGECLWGAEVFLAENVPTFAASRWDLVAEDASKAALLESAKKDTNLGEAGLREVIDAFQIETLRVLRKEPLVALLEHTLPPEPLPLPPLGEEAFSSLEEYVGLREMWFELIESKLPLIRTVRVGDNIGPTYLINKAAESLGNPVRWLFLNGRSYAYFRKLGRDVLETTSDVTHLRAGLVGWISEFRGSTTLRGRAPIVVKRFEDLVGPAPVAFVASSPKPDLRSIVRLVWDSAPEKSMFSARDAWLEFLRENHQDVRTVKIREETKHDPKECLRIASEALGSPVHGMLLNSTDYAYLRRFGRDVLDVEVHQHLLREGVMGYLTEASCGEVVKDTAWVLVHRLRFVNALDGKVSFYLSSETPSLDAVVRLVE